MRIFFVHSGFGESFSYTEYRLLECVYNVEEADLRHKMKLVTFAKTLMSLKSVYRSDLVICYFASLHSFLPTVFAKLLRKKCIVITGGYDVANMPEVGYGLLRSGIRKMPARFVVRTILRLADLILTFSKFSAREAINNGNAEPRKVKPMYLGFEFDDWHIGANKEDLVVTVGGIDRETMIRKGIETFVRSASFLPHVRFVCIGKWEDDAIEYLRSIATPNVEFTGFLTDQELRQYLGRAKVYVQTLAHAGFGLAVAEAMLSECIPIVSDVGSLPEVVGTAGIYVETGDPKAIADKVTQGLELGENAGKVARQRIVGMFSMDTHKAELYDHVTSLLGLGR